jgi:vancomycin permeability regulator SanA
MPVTLKTIIRLLWKLLLGAGFIGGLALLLPRSITALFSIARVFSVAEAPAEPVAIVFGAGLRRDGTATAILRDRVQTAADLYRARKVQRLLMSGDNSRLGYNEPEAMRQYALTLGIPDGAIVLDYAGRRTYDTCYRARAIFGLPSAVLVTQDFHMARALYTCNALGLPAVGVRASNFYYLKRSRLYWNLRELLATTGAFVDLFITKPLPVLGEPEPILASK